MAYWWENTTQSEQFQNKISKSLKGEKSILIAYKIMTAHFAVREQALQ
jgi:hypothetical protein